MADEKRCKRIDEGKRTGVPGRKLYKVVCHGEGTDLFNVFFDKADTVVLTPLKNPEPFSESESRRMCEDAIKNAAEHPSTVDIHSIMGYATETYGNGMRWVWQNFSSKNDFGLELTYNAICEVNPSGKLNRAMPLDKLWALHEKIDSLLTKKIEAEKRELEQCLDTLKRKFGHSTNGDRRRRPYPKVLPKFQNPKQPSQTWAGRGRQRVGWVNF